MPSEHAKLSPSAAERWLQCPASIRMEEQVPPEPESEYAAEGTAAHSLGEIKASLEFGLITAEQGKVARAAWADLYNESLEAWDLAEMERHTDAYVALLKEKLAEHPDAQILLEQRMDTGVPTCWGTSDAVIVSMVHVEIVDFKYGSGVRVDAEGNPQLRLYACGAMDTFADLLGETEEIRITVFQPRIGEDGHVSTEVLHPDELREWRESIKPIATEALSDDAHFGPSDEACRWCPASGRCRAQLEAVFAQDFDVQPETLEPEEMAEALARIPAIRQWLSAFEEAALSAAYSEGKTIPGYKVVVSGGRRAVNDAKGLEKSLLAAGYTRDQFTQTKPVGIGELEKLLGKEKWGLAEPYIKKGEGKPSLVPESDKRKAASPEAEAAKDFTKE